MPLRRLAGVHDELPSKSFHPALPAFSVRGG